MVTAMPKPNPIIPAAAFPALGAAAILVFGLAVFSQTSPIFALTVAPPLPTAGERVTITALISNFSASSTTFTWFRDGAKLDAVSGLGRSAISLATDPNQAGAIQIKVEVDPGAGFSRGSAETTVLTLPGAAGSGESATELKSGFSLELSPQNPDAGESIRAEVITFAFDRARADYQWYMNGALQKSQSGRGRFRFLTTAGGQGSKKAIRVDVTTPEGEVRSKSAVAETASLPLYWWADTAVPYWYKGKALPVLGSRVNVAALPFGRNAAQLSYQWKFNDAVLSTASGAGQQTFSLKLEFPVEEDISVTISDAGGTFEKTAATTVRPTQPSAGLYEVRTLRGMVFERQLSEFSAPAGEPYDFAAVPFFFRSGAALSYLWSIDDELITGTFNRPWIFTLTSSAGQSSFNRIGVEILDQKKNGPRVSAFLQTSLR